MAYQTTIPGANDILSVSQGDIQGNFVALGTMLDPNNSFFIAPSTAATPITNATTMAISVGAKTIAQSDSAVSMYLAPINTALPIDEIEFTAAKKNGNGFTMLPSGIMMMWGTGTLAQASASTVYGFAASFGLPSFANAALSIQVTPTNVAVNPNDARDFIIAAINNDVATFTVRRSVNWSFQAVNFNFLAIGY